MTAGGPGTRCHQQAPRFAKSCGMASRALFVDTMAWLEQLANWGLYSSSSSTRWSEHLCHSNLQNGRPVPLTPKDPGENAISWMKVNPMNFKNLKRRKPPHHMQYTHHVTPYTVHHTIKRTPHTTQFFPKFRNWCSHTGIPQCSECRRDKIRTSQIRRRGRTSDPRKVAKCFVVQLVTRVDALPRFPVQGKDLVQMI